MAPSGYLILTLTLSAALIFSPASSQITTPCTPSMITNFTPCVNFVTNSSLNGTTPTSDCCSSLKSLVSSGKDCFCLIATGSVPFQIPVSLNLALNLPRACNTPGVPLQCKAVGAPVPAPGPVAFGLPTSPNASPSPQAQAPPEALSPSSNPQADAPPSTTTVETPTNGGATSTGNTGSRAGVTPSAAHPTYTMSPLLLVAGIVALGLKYY